VPLGGFGVGADDGVCSGLEGAADGDATGRTGGAGGWLDGFEPREVGGRTGACVELIEDGTGCFGTPLPGARGGVPGIGEPLTERSGAAATGCELVPAGAAMAKAGPTSASGR
jgi:hypothetical protein